MGRYIYTPILDNDSEYYRFLRNKRQHQKNIRQYATPVLHNPGLAERMAISLDSHIWTVGDHFWKLAAAYYGDPTYWWVIAWYNGYPTEADISPGMVVDIPTSLESALTILGY
tara:strand:- start:6172 stop:6510 length:339 start_codon:yes stop_codon:yes gene_type:complete